MAAVQRFKFQGSQIRVMTGFNANSPAQPITAITRANPAVVTSATHGLVDGSVVQITGVVGMTEVNDRIFVVNQLTANTFELTNVDSTDYTAYISGGDVDTAEFSNFCELTGYNRQGGSKPETAVTALCSDAAEYELGLRDFGTTQLDFHFAPRTNTQEALETYDDSGDMMAVHIILPNSGGEYVQTAFVQQQSDSVSVNGVWTGSATLRNTGKRVYVAA